MKHLLIIFSILLLSSPVIGQSSKPFGVVIPPTVMGNVSDSRKQILLNTFDEEISKFFDVSPPPKIESGELPVVEDIFQIQIIEEDGDTQLTLRWMSGTERKIETILCGGCKTIELNGKLEGLVGKLIEKRKVNVSVKKSELKSKVVDKNKENKVVLFLWGEGNTYGQVWEDFGDENNHSKFVGEVSNGKPNGHGTTTFPDGRKHVGEYKNGQISGQGTLTYPDGGKYVGEFKKDKPNGKGKYTSSDGGKFFGEWKNGEKWNGTEYDKKGNIKHKRKNGNKCWTC